MSRSKKLIHHLKNLVKLDTKSRSINNEFMRKVYYSLGVLAIVVISGTIGYFIGTKYSPTSNSTSSQSYKMPGEKPKADSFFNAQTATLQGVVTKVSTNKILTLKSKTSQVSDFPLAKNFVVYTYTDTSRTAAASSEVKSIQLNKNATFVLNLLDNTYQITTITFLPK